MKYRIGANEEVSLQSVKDNAYEYYIPLATATMPLDELTKNRDLFQAQIDAWINQLSGSTNATEINNISQIIEIQTGRLADYDKMIAQQTAAPPTDTGEVPQMPQVPTTKSWMPIILIALAALYFFTKKKRA